jgi:hypothetical protein
MGNNCGLLTVAASAAARKESSGMHTYMYGSPDVELPFLKLYQRVSLTPCIYTIFGFVSTRCLPQPRTLGGYMSIVSNCTCVDCCSAAVDTSTCTDTAQRHTYVITCVSSDVLKEHGRVGFAFPFVESRCFLQCFCQICAFSFGEQCQSNTKGRKRTLWVGHLGEREHA